MYCEIQKYTCVFPDQTSEEGRKSPGKGNRAEENRARQCPERESAFSKDLWTLSTGASGM